MGSLPKKVLLRSRGALPSRILNMYFNPLDQNTIVPSDSPCDVAGCQDSLPRLQYPWLNIHKCNTKALKIRKPSRWNAQSTKKHPVENMRAAGHAAREVTSSPGPQYSHWG